MLPFVDKPIHINYPLFDITFVLGSRDDFNFHLIAGF